MFHRDVFVGGVDFQHKFGGVFGGANQDVPFDIWDIKSPYPFPEVVGTTTLVSDSNEDSPGKSGALLTSVFGLDRDLRLCSVVERNAGQEEVTLSKEFFRVFRINIELAGSTETNVGNVDVKHGPIVLARVQPTYGSTLMAIYTISMDYQKCYLKKLYLDVSRVSPGQESEVTAHFQYRKFGGAWQVKHPVRLSTRVAHWDYEFPDPGLSLPSGSDLRWRVLDVSGSGVICFAGFDLREVK